MELTRAVLRKQYMYRGRLLFYDSYDRTHSTSAQRRTCKSSQLLLITSIRSALLAVGRCPSVCQTRVLYRNGYKILSHFSLPCRPIILVYTA